jgi:hypothetical protein
MMNDPISELHVLFLILGLTVLGLIAIVSIDVMTNPVYAAERQAKREKRMWLERAKKRLHPHVQHKHRRA